MPRHLTSLLPRFPRLPFTRPHHHQRTDTASSSSLAKSSNSPSIDSVDSIVPPCPEEEAFPLLELPVELLGEIVDHVVCSLLGHPRKVCYCLDEILGLRLVCSTFSTEISRSLHNNLTLPNFPRPLLSRSLQPTYSPPATHRTAYHASALYNSSLSLSNRHVGSKDIKRLSTVCLEIAEHIELAGRGTYSPARRKQVLRMLCVAAAAAATQGVPRYAHLDGPSLQSVQRTAWTVVVGLEALVADALCIAVIIGEEEWYLARRGKIVRPASNFFGDPVECAERWGRVSVVEAEGGTEGGMVRSWRQGVYLIQGKALMEKRPQLSLGEIFRGRVGYR